MVERAQIAAKATRRQVRPEVKVLYFRSRFEADLDDGEVMVLLPEQPVQLAMFAL